MTMSMQTKADLFVVANLAGWGAFGGYKLARRYRHRHRNRR